MTKLSKAQAERLLHDLRIRTVSYPKLMTVWLETLREAAEETASKGTETPFATRALMWIRLYGLLADVASDLQAKKAIVAKLVPVPEAAALLKGLEGPLLALVDALAKVRAALSQDELLFVAFARHHEAHPFPTLDTAEIKRGLFNDQRTVFGESHRSEVIGNACQRVLVAHRLSDARVAAHVSRKILPPLRDVISAWNTYRQVQ